MTNREYLHEPPHECPDCGEEYQRLGRHWSSGDCDPIVPRDQHELIKGVVLAGASVEAGSLQVRNKRRQLVEWTADELDWLVSTLTHVVRDDADHDVLRTPSHHALDRYESWIDGPPADYTLSRRTARVWWAFAGGLQWQGSYDSQRTATISALHDDRAEWVLRLLGDAGVDATRAGKRVQWHGDQLRDWLEWIGDPVPGVEYKWAKTQDEYRTARDA